MVEIGGIKYRGSFEIFPSNGSWALLVGKPLLTTFDVVHRYGDDTITIPRADGNVTISNQFGRTQDCQWTTGLASICLTADIKQRKALGGNHYSPSRQVPHPCNKEREQNDETPIASEPPVSPTPKPTESNTETEQAIKQKTTRRAAVEEVEEETEPTSTGPSRANRHEKDERSLTMAMGNHRQRVQPQQGKFLPLLGKSYLTISRNRERKRYQ